MNFQNPPVGMAEIKSNVTTKVWALGRNLRERIYQMYEEIEREREGDLVMLGFQMYESAKIFSGFWRGFLLAWLFTALQVRSGT